MQDRSKARDVKKATRAVRFATKPLLYGVDVVLNVDQRSEDLTVFRTIGGRGQTRRLE